MTHPILDKLAIATGSNLYDRSTQSRRKHGPPADAEWHRVWRLPRRTYDPDEAAQLAEGLTAMLRRPGSEAKLRPAQAIALAEISAHGSFLGALPVGSGKTLITLLAPIVANAPTRYLLIVPAKLERKTRIERTSYRSDWRIPDFYQAISVERLARVSCEDYLDRHTPELIIVDEAHRLASRGSKPPSAAKRIHRYLQSNPNTKVVLLTGTLGDDPSHYAHLLRWVGGRNAPIPATKTAADLWADALCERSALGAFERFGDPRDAREAYRERIASTARFDVRSDDFEAPLVIRPWERRLSAAQTELLAELDETWCVNDQPIDDPLAAARAAYTIALGFYMRWREPAPEPWAEARKAWAAFVREQTSGFRSHYDTEEHVRRAVEAGDLPDGVEVLESWVAIRDMFEPDPEVEWLCDDTVNDVMEWAERPGIVWYRHRAIAQALAKRGLRVYGRKSLDGTGKRHIMQHPGDTACAASQQSSGEGVNLQQFTRALILEPPSRSDPYEQIIGRCHRPGQTRTVTVDVHMATDWHRRAWGRALESARLIHETLGQRQKLLKGMKGMNE